MSTTETVVACKLQQSHVQQVNLVHQPVGTMLYMFVTTRHPPIYTSNNGPKFKERLCDKSYTATHASFAVAKKGHFHRMLEGRLLTCRSCKA